MMMMMNNFVRHNRNLLIYRVPIVSRVVSFPGEMACHFPFPHAHVFSACDFGVVSFVPFVERTLGLGRSEKEPLKLTGVQDDACVSKPRVRFFLK